MKKAQDVFEKPEGTRTRSRVGRKGAESSVTPTTSSGNATETTTNTWDSGTSTTAAGSNTEVSATRTSDSREAVATEVVAENPARAGEEDQVSIGTVVGRDKDRRSYIGSRSSRSTRLRAELEARIKFEQSELEKARAAAALAKSKMELARLVREEDLESSEDEEERPPPRVEPYVHSWVQHSILNVPGTQPKENPAGNPRESDREAGDRQETVFTHKKNAKEKTEVSALTDALVSAIKIAGGERASSHYLHELPYFDGNSSEWIVFKTVFEDTKKNFTGVQNVARLRKALRGAARETVRSLLFTLSEPSEILNALERRYGRAESLIISEIEGLKRMPKLADDGRNIGMFANKVANTVASIRALNKPHYLHSPELVSRIEDKLGTIIKFKWYEYRSSNTSEPELVKMANFLNFLCDQFGASFASENAYSSERRRRPEYVKGQKKSVHATKRYDMQEDDTRKEYGRKKSHSENKWKSVMTANDKPRKWVVKKCAICQREHIIYNCEQFKKMNCKEKWDAVKKARLCFQCLAPNHRKDTCRAKKCGIKGCRLSHHRLLHNEAYRAPFRDREKVTEAQITTVNTIGRIAYAYLKIIPVELYGPLGKVSVMALLDEGSTTTLIEEETAKRIAPRGTREELRIEGIGGNRIDDSRSYRLSLKIKGKHMCEKESITAQTIKTLNLSPQAVSSELLRRCPHLASVKSELVYDKAKPTILVGQDNWHLIVTRDLKTGEKHLPVASYTKLGWVLHGCISGRRKPFKLINYTSERREESIERMLKEHFSLESLGIAERKPASDPEARAVRILEETIRRTNDSRYEVGLPWKTDNEVMPENKLHAERRLFNIERKLDKDEKLKIEYTKQMENLLEKGYAERVTTTPTSPRTWYLPHFAVVHPQKGKLRLVFDAAARTGGRCLNDALLKGPDLLQSLFGVLLRFREGSVAVMADIKEMFLQVKIRTEDRDSLRFLWRTDRSAPPQEYRMTSLIFGAASSPCTAIYVKNRNAKDHAHMYPDAAIATERNFYMDDYLQAFPDVESARRIIRDMDKLHKHASFELRGWASNQPEVLRHVSNTHKSDSAILGDSDHAERTLGLIWNIKRDTLSFVLNLRNTPEEAIGGLRPPTKREITSAVMSIFDPLGFASPITIQGKALIQQTWRVGTSWDALVPEEIDTQWQSWLQKLRKLAHLEIPRSVIEGCIDQGELHVFTDASEKAYAAAVYYVTACERKGRKATLLAAKAKVTPLKPVSIPRLELQAALLGCRLVTSVKKEINFQVKSRTFWTDSTTVLAWIRSDPRTFKPFVAHRLAEIEEYSKPSEWRWVPTAENVADDATRGAPSTFAVTHRWFTGPIFLCKEPEFWPKQKDKVVQKETGEERQSQKVNVIKEIESPCIPKSERFSSYTRLVRATARVLQAVSKFKSLLRHGSEPGTAGPDESTMQDNRSDESLKPSLLLEAERHIIKCAQLESFKEELECLAKKKSIGRGSRLSRIAVEIDCENILRLNGRLPQRQHLTYAYRKPIILDGKHKVSRLIIKEAHEHFGHGNHRTVINEIVQKYYMLAMRSAVRRVVHECQWCKLRRARPQVVPQGNLPAERIAYYEPPFTCTGCDYFGPMHVTVGRRKEKRWGVLFTCLTTRAVHLELAASLTPSSMIMALRRFIARRGKPRLMYSDNGTNFKAADKELQQAYRESHMEMKSDAEGKYITWKYIPPGAPHMGGAWERLIRTIKTALAATLKEQCPREEVLHTLLLEAEQTVNSRPLITVNLESPEEGLTPNHFLLGRSSGDRPPGLVSKRDLIGQANWKTTQLLADYFWSRWLKEYLPTLLPRNSCDGRFVDPKIGDIVLIVDHSSPRNTWPRGRVHRTLPGADGRTRVIDVVTSNGILRRPTSRIVILVSAPISEDSAPAPRGDC